MGAVAKWKIAIVIENLNEKKTVMAGPVSLVGQLLLDLTAKLSVDVNWSDYALWWPERCTWITTMRSSLDQYGMYSGCTLEFICFRKLTYIILPDLRITKACIDVSRNTIQAVEELCLGFNISRYEELSLMIINEDDFSPSSSGRTKSSVNARKSKSDIDILASRINQVKQYVDSSPAVNLQSCDFSLDINPVLEGLFPQSASLIQWCKFHEKWVNSAKSLKEQGFDSNNNIVYLRYKYSNFFDLKPKLSPIRFHYIFSHAAMSVKLQELRVDEAELFEFVAMMWHVILTKKGWVKPRTAEQELSGSMIDDVDDALNMLECSLQGSEPSASKNMENSPINNDKYCSENCLQDVFCKEDSKNKTLYVLNGSTLTIYKGEQILQNKLKNTLNLSRSSISQSIKFNKNTFIIKITPIDVSGKSNPVDIVCTSEEKFILWLAACRSVSRGLYINHSYFENEKMTLKAFLELKRNIDRKRASCMQPGEFFIEKLFPDWIFKKKGITQDIIADRLLECYMPYCNMSLTDVQTSFINKWQGVSTHNMIPFLVTIDNLTTTTKSSSNKKNPLVLGVCSKYVAVLDANTEEILEKWSYIAIKQWSVNWQTNSQLFHLDDKKVSVSAISANIKAIHECVGGSIFMNTRKDISVSLDIGLFFKLTA